MDYERYMQAFNSGDDAQLVHEWFTEDCIFQSGPRLLRGRDELLEFLHWAHDGVREIIRAQTVLQDANRLFAEIDMDFHASRDRPDFLFGALAKGEFLTVKFFVLYLLRDGKIAHLKAAKWPANVGVTQPAVRLGSTLEQRQAFMEYTRAFSNAEFERFSRYYTDDVTCTLTRGIVLRGKDSIVEFYREMFKRVRETLTLHHLIADDTGIAADITSQFTAIEDAPEFVVAPLAKGEFVRVPVFVHYELTDGRISRISVARSGEVSKPQRA
ncbi:MAG: nuclear transport factor 2 family protein [Steroidobacteraceae bacterium]